MSRAAATGAHELSEHLVENIGEAAAEAELEAAGPPATAILERGVAEAVISRPLLLVLQDVIGLVDFLEFVLGRCITRIAVRVILHGEPAIGSLNVLDRCAARETKRGVVVLLRHDKPWRTTPCPKAARLGRPPSGSLLLQ